MKIDFNGHCGREPGVAVPLTDLPSYYAFEIERAVEREERWLALLSEHKTDIELRDIGITPEIRCSECGKRVYLKRDGDIMRAEIVCDYPGGMPAYSVLLNVPSGKIVFANDLRDLVDVDDPDESVNSKLGCKLTTQAYEKAGMVHISVGNTCPGVFREPDGSLTVACRYIDEEDPMMTDEEYQRLDAELDKTRVASICTDLWWYCAMDYDHYVARCAATGTSLKENAIDIVEVEPGVYEFTDEMPNRDAPGETVFSRITKSDKAAPVLESEEGEAATFSESRVMRAIEKVRHMWPGTASLEYMFCTLGNGYDWLGGHLRNQAGRDDEEPYDRLTPTWKPKHIFDDSAIPVFPSAPDSIYPMSWQYPGKLGIAPLNIDPWWLATGLIFAKTVLANPQCFYSRERADNAENEKIMRASYAYLCDIVVERGIDIAPYVNGVMAEWKPNPTRAEKRERKTEGGLSFEEFKAASAALAKAFQEGDDD